jgi:hypothetical protein
MIPSFFCIEIQFLQFPPFKAQMSFPAYRKFPLLQIHASGHRLLSCSQPIITTASLPVTFNNPAFPSFLCAFCHFAAQSHVKIFLSPHPERPATKTVVYLSTSLILALFVSFPYSKMSFFRNYTFSLFFAAFPLWKCLLSQSPEIPSAV